jgi:hypothetical protein
VFQISALPLDNFKELFSLDDESLAARGAKRYVADRTPGFPCRVSLEDAALGERVILVPFCHLPERSPYRAVGPIFVREASIMASLPPRTIPTLLRSRLLSVKGYDASHLMVAAEVVDGRELESSITRVFARDAVVYAHIHFAGPGCYACRADRA